MGDAWIAGRVYGYPKKGVGKNGSPYVTARVQAACGDGESVSLLGPVTVRNTQQYARATSQK